MNGMIEFKKSKCKNCGKEIFYYITSEHGGDFGNNYWLHSQFEQCYSPEPIDDKNNLQQVQGRDQS